MNHTINIAISCYQCVEWAPDLIVHFDWKIYFLFDHLNVGMLKCQKILGKINGQNFSKISKILNKLVFISTSTALSLATDTSLSTWFYNCLLDVIGFKYSSTRRKCQALVELLMQFNCEILKFVFGWIYDHKNLKIWDLFICIASNIYFFKKANSL